MNKAQWITLLDFLDYLFTHGAQDSASREMFYDLWTEFITPTIDRELNEEN